MSTLGTILRDNWQWRKQIVRLALFDLQKQSRGAVMGWAWFFIQPAIYVCCFWFALEIGLRAGRSTPGDAPYILWLMTGMIPWFFMRNMLGPGIDVLHKYSYMVNKVKFPISAISTLYTLATFIIQLMLQCIVLVVYFLCGMGLDLYLLQVPVLLLVMAVFWDMFSIMFSPLCAISKDIKNFMGSLGTPLFWLSGVIFNVRDVPIDWIQTLLDFNPITFFVSCFRCAYYTKTWVWEDPTLCVGFVVVFVLTLLCMLFVYKRLNEEVVDVL